jgi:hypothetical protein
MARIKRKGINKSKSRGKNKGGDESSRRDRSK